MVMGQELESSLYTVVLLVPLAMVDDVEENVFSGEKELEMGFSERVKEEGVGAAVLVSASGVLMGF